MEDDPIENSQEDSTNPFPPTSFSSLAFALKRSVRDAKKKAFLERDVIVSPETTFQIVASQLEDLKAAGVTRENGECSIQLISSKLTEELDETWQQKRAYAPHQDMGATFSLCKRLFKSLFFEFHAKNTFPRSFSANESFFVKDSTGKQIFNDRFFDIDMPHLADGTLGEGIPIDGLGKLASQIAKYTSIGGIVTFLAKPAPESFETLSDSYKLKDKDKITWEGFRYHVVLGFPFPNRLSFFNHHPNKDCFDQTATRLRIPFTPNLAKPESGPGIYLPYETYNISDQKCSLLFSSADWLHMLTVRVNDTEQCAIHDAFHPLGYAHCCHHLGLNLFLSLFSTSGPEPLEIAKGFIFPSLSQSSQDTQETEGNEAEEDEAEDGPELTEKERKLANALQGFSSTSSLDQCVEKFSEVYNEVCIPTFNRLETSYPFNSSTILYALSRVETTFLNANSEANPMTPTVFLAKYTHIFFAFVSRHLIKINDDYFFLKVSTQFKKLARGNVEIPFREMVPLKKSSLENLFNFQIISSVSFPKNSVEERNFVFKKRAAAKVILESTDGVPTFSSYCWRPQNGIFPSHEFNRFQSSPVFNFSDIFNEEREKKITACLRKLKMFFKRVIFKGQKHAMHLFFYTIAKRLFEPGITNFDSDFCWIFVGVPGSGKSFFIRLISLLFGQNAIGFSKMKDLTGDFARFASEVLFAFVDENLDGLKFNSAEMRTLISGVGRSESKGVNMGYGDVSKVVYAMFAFACESFSQACISLNSRRDFLVEVLAALHLEKDFFINLEADMIEVGIWRVLMRLRDWIKTFLSPEKLDLININSVVMSSATSRCKAENMTPLESFVASFVRVFHFPEFRPRNDADVDLRSSLSFYNNLMKGIPLLLNLLNGVEKTNPMTPVLDSILLETGVSGDYFRLLFSGEIQIFSPIVPVQYIYHSYVNHMKHNGNLLPFNKLINAVKETFNCCKEFQGCWEINSSVNQPLDYIEPNATSTFSPERKTPVHFLLFRDPHCLRILFRKFYRLHADFFEEHGSLKIPNVFKGKNTAGKNMYGPAFEKCQQFISNVLSPTSLSLLKKRKRKVSFASEVSYIPIPQDFDNSLDNA